MSIIFEFTLLVSEKNGNLKCIKLHQESLVCCSIYVVQHCRSLVEVEGNICGVITLLESSFNKCLSQYLSYPRMLLPSRELDEGSILIPPMCF